MTKLENRLLAWSIGFCMWVTLAVAPVIAQTTSSATTGQTAASTSTSKKKAKADASAEPATAAAPGVSASAAAPAPANRAAPVPSATASSTDIVSAKASGKVWVNTDSQVYHKSGRWYGTTKKGKFMTEDEAKAAGYRAAKKE
jgi:hypothetical protein